MCLTAQIECNWFILKKIIYIVIKIAIREKYTCHCKK